MLIISQLLLKEPMSCLLLLIQPVINTSNTDVWWVVLPVKHQYDAAGTQTGFLVKYIEIKPF